MGSTTIATVRRTNKRAGLAAWPESLSVRVFRVPLHAALEIECSLAFVEINAGKLRKLLNISTMAPIAGMFIKTKSISDWGLCPFECWGVLLGPFPRVSMSKNARPVNHGSGFSLLRGAKRSASHRSNR